MGKKWSICSGENIIDKLINSPKFQISYLLIYFTILKSFTSNMKIIVYCSLIIGEIGRAHV